MDIDRDESINRSVQSIGTEPVNVKPAVWNINSLIYILRNTDTGLFICTLAGILVANVAFFAWTGGGALVQESTAGISGFLAVSGVLSVVGGWAGYATYIYIL